MINIVNNFNKKISGEATEVVERKGIGHPDTLADLIAETYSKIYSEFCLKRFGCILNHSSDKVLLSGAKVNVTFGKYKILKPITAYLFGKSTTNVGRYKIDINEIFKQSVQHVLFNVFKNKDIFKYVNYVIDINDGVGSEHAKVFYMPDNIQDLKKSREMYLSNDTVACCAYAGYSISEYLTIVLENYINSAAFKNNFPETGYDVKVLTVRNFTNTFDITICIPFIAQKTKSLLFYKQRIIELKSVILDKAKKITKNNYVKLYINTKDEEIGAYLTVFGSALDKGDFGVVGRGNRFNGVISLNREMSIEASSGKNPLHHAGKIYSLLSQDIANDIYSKFKIENYINIIAKNGHFLTDPAFIIVKFNNNSIDSKIIDKIVTNRLKNIKSYPRRIIRMDPVKHFKSLRTFAL